MGNLTDDMTRLCGEIVSLRNARGDLMAELASGARDLTDYVSSMQADFCDARRKMAKKTKAELAAFVSGVKTKVMNMREEMSGDLAGARRAWSGLTEADLFGKRRQLEAEARRKKEERKRAEEKLRAKEKGTAKEVKTTPKGKKGKH